MFKQRRMLLILAITLLLSVMVPKAFPENIINIIVNGQQLYPDVPPQIINGRTMVPIRFIAEIFNANVNWEESTQTVYINSNNPNLPGNKPTGRPAAPNNSVVTGEVVGFSIVSPSIIDKQTIKAPCSLQLLVKTSTDVDGMANFTKDKIGDVICVYSKQELSPDIYRKKISANIVYFGDERGGAFWISDINISNSQ